MKFHVPTLNNSEAANSLKKTILTSEPEADVSIDLDSKKVNIESKASAETFKELIVASGHKIS